MHRIISIVFLISIVVSPLPLSARGIEDLPHAPGLESAVGRMFEPAGQKNPSIYFLEARSVQFQDSSSATNAIDLWFAQLIADDESYLFDLSSLRPVGVSPVGDEVRAVTGTVSRFDDPDVTVEVAAVVVRNNNVLLALLSWSTHFYVVDETIQIAERTLGLEPLELAPVGGIPYNEGDVWSRLPRIEHLPEGLTWERDFQPCVGVFGGNECPADAGTPVATPAD